MTVPDVLFQAHSAPLGITFYEGAQFPAEYKGDAFVAFHGSWNRAPRTGYKVVRLLMKDGKPTGAYEDFLTGFVATDDDVWGRPVDVAETKDGALLVTDDGRGGWRVTHRSRPAPVDVRARDRGRRVDGSGAGAEREARSPAHRRSSRQLGHGAPARRCGARRPSGTSVMAWP